MRLVALSVAVAMLIARGKAQTSRTAASTDPALPNTITQDLQSRGCKPLNKKSQSIISGEFFGPGQTDWAVLCSTRKNTSLLVYRGGSQEQVAVLETMRRGFSKWSINVISREQVNTIKSTWGWRGPAPPEIDHQGISSFVEFGSPGARLCCYSAEDSTYYYHANEWLVPLRTAAN